MWVLGIKSWSSGRAASALTTEPPFYLLRMSNDQKIVRRNKEAWFLLVIANVPDSPGGNNCCGVVCVTSVPGMLSWGNNCCGV